MIRRLNSEGAGPGQIGVEGLIVFCPNHSWQAYVVKALDMGLPVALVRRSLPGRPGLLVITDNDYLGMMQAMTHLHQVHHHHCIGLCGFYNSRAESNPRLKACLDYFSIHEMESAPALILTEQSVQSPASERMLGWVKRCRKDYGMTAVQCWSDESAASLVKSLLQAGIRVPEDVAVVGVNNDPTAAIFHPGITTVHVPVEEMVTAACLYHLDYSVKTPPVVQTRFNQSLVIRDSCGTH